MASDCVATFPQVVLTNPAHKFGGMLQTLIALKEQHGWYEHRPNQL